MSVSKSLNTAIRKVKTYLQVLQPSLDFGANLRGLFLQAWLAVFVFLFPSITVICELSKICSSTVSGRGQFQGHYESTTRKPPACIGFGKGLMRCRWKFKMMICSSTRVSMRKLSPILCDGQRSEQRWTVQNTKLALKPDQLAWIPTIYSSSGFRDKCWLASSYMRDPKKKSDRHMPCFL